MAPLLWAPWARGPRFIEPPEPPVRFLRHCPDSSFLFVNFCTLVMSFYMCHCKEHYSMSCSGWVVKNRLNKHKIVKISSALALSVFHTLTTRLQKKYDDEFWWWWWWWWWWYLYMHVGIRVEYPSALTKKYLVGKFLAESALSVLKACTDRSSLNSIFSH